MSIHIRYLKMLTVAGVCAGAFCSARPALAMGYYWDQLSGCGRSIAVGANDVPWIVGCPEPGEYVPQYDSGPTSVYYLGQAGNFIPEWIPDNMANAMTLAVSLNGNPFITDSNGHLFTDGGGGQNGDVVPMGFWIEMNPGPGQSLGAAGAFAAGVTQDTYGGNVGLWFEPGQSVNEYSDPYDLMTFWSIGCDGLPCNEGPFYGDSSIWTSSGSFWRGLAYQLTSWTREPGAAKAVALFTEPPNSGTRNDGTNTVQIPWILTAEGAVWHQKPPGWFHVTTPEPMISITDHHALGKSGQVYTWTGDSYGGSCSGTSCWSAIGPAMSTLFQIAWSQAASASFIGGVAQTQIGPSQLWALDIWGTPYELEWSGFIL